MTEQLDSSLSPLSSINDSASRNDDWDRSLNLSDVESPSHSFAQPISENTTRNSILFPVDSDIAPSRTRANTTESPAKEGKRPLSELLRLHAEKGTDVNFSVEEASRVAEVLGQWINASSSPYEDEDDFFTRSHDDLSIPSAKNSFSPTESRPRGQSEGANLRSPSSTGSVQ